MPEEMAGPYRATLTKLQEAGPAAARRHGARGPRRGARPALAHREVPSVRRHARPPRPRSARCTGRSGATGARSPSRSSTPARPRPCCPTSTSSPGWPGWPAAWIPGIDIKPITDELKSRMSRGARLQPRGRQPAAASPRRSADDPHFVVPDVLVNSEHVIVSEWIDGTPLSTDHRLGHPGAARRRLRGATWSSCWSARAAPGCCTPTRTRATSGSLADGRLGVHRLRRGQPAPARAAAGDGRADRRRARRRGARTLEDGLRREGFIKPSMSARRRGAARLPRARSSSRCSHEEFTFSRAVAARRGRARQRRPPARVPRRA